MTALDRLPPDQRAVLSLVFDRGKSYSQVAEMLAIPESAVRDRAHAALDAIAGGTAGAPAAGGAATASFGVGKPDPSTPRSLSELTASAGGEGTSQRARGERPPREPGEARPLAARAPSSRLGGALLLAVIVAIIVVAVILISSGGKGSSKNTASGPSHTSTTGTTSKNSPKLEKTIKLTPTDPELKAAGEAYVLSESGRRAFYVAIQGLPASSGFFYAVWLYTSPSRAAPLGRAPTVNSNGRMEGGGPLPSNASSYQELIITRETSTHPTHPGPVVMRGPFSLH